MNTAREKLTHGFAQAGRADVQGHGSAGCRGAQPGPQAGPAPKRKPTARPQPKKDEGVIDAEYVDVEDKK